MKSIERRRLFVLNNPNAPRLSPELAKEIGLPESIILLQLEFWISISDHNVDGKWWTYQSIRGIQKTFVFWSPETINRAIKNLLKMGLIEVGNFNKKKYDKTRWFTIVDDAVNKLESIQMETTLSQNETPWLKDGQGVSNQDRVSHFETHSSQNVTTIPETTSETTSETTKPENKKAEPSPVDIIFKAIHAFYGYPDKIKTDPIPNYGKEGKAIKKMIDRGFSLEQIMMLWQEKVKKRGAYCSMVWVNEDIAGSPDPIAVSSTEANFNYFYTTHCRRFAKEMGRDPTSGEMAEISAGIREKIAAGWSMSEIRESEPSVSIEG